MTKNSIPSDKSLKIKNTLLATREKRLSQFCKVFSLKIVANHLSSKKETFIDQMFLQAKWLYNYAIAELNFLYISAPKTVEHRIDKKGTSYSVEIINTPSLYYASIDSTLKYLSTLSSVPVKVKDSFLQRDISALPSAIK